MRRVCHCVLLALGMLCPASAAWAQQPGSSPGPDGPRGWDGGLSPVMRLFDTDNDGALSDAEITAAAARLKHFDTNHDGKLSADELRKALPAPPSRGPGDGPGRGGPRGAAPAANSMFQSPIVPKDDQEKAIVDALNEARHGPRFANVPPTDGRLLRLLTEAVGAKRVVEIGTSTGESGIWFALALRTTGGHLYTHEIDPGRAKVAESNFKKAGVDKFITVILGDAHETVKQHKEPIDVLFLDADKEGYIDYLNKLMPLLRPGGLIIAHNMNTRQADPKYVEAITKDPKLETTFLLMEGTGVGVTLKKR